MKKLFLSAIAALGCIAAILVIQYPQLQQLKGETQLSEAELEQQEDFKQLQLQLLQDMPTFGFDNLLADLVFLDFLQYFGDTEARDMTGYSLAPDFFEVVVDNDPLFQDMYLFLTSGVTLYAGQPQTSVALMEEGLASMTPYVPPQSYYVWRNKAIDELLFLGDSEAARQSYLTAAEWASVHDDPASEAAEQYSRQTAEFLANNPDSRLAQAGAWSQILVRAVDEDMRQDIIERIEALGGEVTIGEGAVRVTLPQED